MLSHAVLSDSLSCVSGSCRTVVPLHSVVWCCRSKVGVACAKVVGFGGASLLLLLMAFKFMKVCVMMVVTVRRACR